jgi:putative acetyltransferase
MALTITEGGLDDPRVIALLTLHVSRARAVTPPGSSHALDLSGLKQPAITFWSGWEGETLAVVGALKRMSGEDGEVKSMHTAEALRGRGHGRAMLAHIIAAARTQGLARLWLETGSFGYFDAARAMYAKAGFVECDPFGDYRPDPNSTFMTLPLR